MPTFRVEFPDGSIRTIEAKSRASAKRALQSMPDVAFQGAARERARAFANRPGAPELRASEAGEGTRGGRPPIPGPEIERGGLAGLPARAGLTDRDAREVLIAGGSALGGLAAGGPSAGLGFPVGMALGAAGANTLADVAGVDPSGSIGESVRRSTESAAFDLTTFGLASRIGAAGLSLRRRVAQVNESAAALAERYGIQLGIEDVSGRGAIRGFRNVFGKFPLLTAPLGEASERKGRQAAAAVENVFDDVAPQVSPDRLSRRAIREGRRYFQGIRNEINQRYSAFRSLAESVDARFDPNLARERASGVLQDIAESSQKMRNDAGEIVRSRLLRDRVAKFADRVARLDDGMRVREYTDLQRQLKQLETTARRDSRNFDAARIASIREGLELDLRAMEGPSEVVDALRSADRFHSKSLRVFERPTGQQFERAQKGIFEQGFEEAGTLNPDELMKVALNSESPQAVSDLRRLIGPQNFREAARLHLSESFKGSLDIAREGAKAGKIVLKVGKLREELGLFGKNNPRRQSLRRMLRETGVSVSDVEGLVRALETAAEQGVVDASTFVARRGILGGASSILASAAPGSRPQSMTGPDVVKAVSKTAIFLIEGRRIGRILTDPAALKAMRRGLSPDTSATVKRQAFLRLGRLLGDEDVEAAGPGQATGLSALISGRGARRGAGVVGAAGLSALRPTVPGVARGLGRAALPLAGSQIQNLTERATGTGRRAVQLTPEQLRALRGSREANP